jgi:tRNA pseudouridine55 synthase
LTGEILQVPPAFSAKHVGGRRAYQLARRGVAVEHRAVRVEVRALDLLGIDGDRADLDVRCSAGTYVRAIARDLGTSLGLGGHLVALRRLRSGPFGLEQAIALEAFTEGLDPQIVPLSGLLLDWPAAVVGAAGRALLRHGRDLVREVVLSGFPEGAGTLVRVVDEQGELLAIADPRGFDVPSAAPAVSPTLHPEIVLGEG